MLLTKSVGKAIDGISEFVLGENIPAYKVIYISSGLIYKAGYNIPLSRDFVIGITLESGNINDTVKVKIDGDIINTNWSFGISGVLFLDIDGELSVVPPTSGYIQKIGIIKNPMTVVIEIGDTIGLN